MKALKQFYKVKESRDEKVVGKDFSQAYKFIKGYNPDAPNAFFSLYKFEDLPDENYNPNLDGVMISGPSKLTDFVGNAFSDSILIFSAKAKEVLDKYNLCPHRIYPLGLYRRKIKYDYFLMKTNSGFANYVDFKKSTCAVYNMKDDVFIAPLDIVFQNKEDFYLRIKEINDQIEDAADSIWHCLQVNKMVVQPSYYYSMDFIISFVNGKEIFVSERLKNAIEEANLTGWEFHLTDELVVEE